MRKTVLVLMCVAGLTLAAVAPVSAHTVVVERPNGDPIEVWVGGPDPSGPAHTFGGDDDALNWACRKVNESAGPVNMYDDSPDDGTPCDPEE